MALGPMTGRAGLSTRRGHPLPGTANGKGKHPGRAGDLRRSRMSLDRRPANSQVWIRPAAGVATVLIAVGCRPSEADHVRRWPCPAATRVDGRSGSALGIDSMSACADAAASRFLSGLTSLTTPTSGVRVRPIADMAPPLVGFESHLPAAAFALRWAASGFRQ